VGGSAVAAPAAGKAVVVSVAAGVVAGVADTARGRASVRLKVIVAECPHVTIQGFVKSLIQEKKTWPSNARCRSSSRTLSQRM
jgi:hypothetical protein